MKILLDFGFFFWENSPVTRETKEGSASREGLPGRPSGEAGLIFKIKGIWNRLLKARECGRPRKDEK
jgi:hypothetical protein